MISQQCLPHRELGERIQGLGKDAGSPKGLNPAPSRPAHVEEKGPEQVTGTKKTALRISQRMSASGC